MTARIVFLVIVVFSTALAFIPQTPLLAGVVMSSDSFGGGTNTFTIDFVGIGNPSNASDVTGYGAVAYQYRIGKYEISYDQVVKSVASGLINVEPGPWAGVQPAASFNWFGAATFVNWLNTSSGHQPAYNLTFSGSWSMALWSSSDAWTLGGANLYRHKDAFYFLPSENEWYKAAYYNPDGASYFLYPTGSDTAPTGVASGTSVGTAVYNFAGSAPAVVAESGGLSPYGTMAQGGNVWEWTESAYDGMNDSGSENRVSLGGVWNDGEFYLSSSHRGYGNPAFSYISSGFRVASITEMAVVPEPGTWAAAALLIGGAAFLRCRRL